MEERTEKVFLRDLLKLPYKDYIDICMDPKYRMINFKNKYRNNLKIVYFYKNREYSLIASRYELDKLTYQEFKQTILNHIELYAMLHMVFYFKYYIDNNSDEEIFTDFIETISIFSRSELNTIYEGCVNIVFTITYNNNKDNWNVKVIRPNDKLDVDVIEDIYFLAPVTLYVFYAVINNF